MIDTSEMLEINWLKILCTVQDGSLWIFLQFSFFFLEWEVVATCLQSFFMSVTLAVCHWGALLHFASRKLLVSC